MLLNKLSDTNIPYEVVETYNNYTLAQIDGTKVKLNFNENIGSNFLYFNGFNGMYIANAEEQCKYGDLYIDEYKGDTIQKNFVDIKSCYVNNYEDTYFFNKFTLAIDLEYFKCYENGEFKYTRNGKYIPYIQSNTNDSLGWLYHLENCDTLLCVCLKYNKIFLIEEFQKLRDFLIDLDRNNNIINNVKTNNLHKRKYASLFTTNISKDNRDEFGNVCKDKVLKRTRTVYLNLEAYDDYFDRIGCKVTSYNYNIV